MQKDFSKLQENTFFGGLLFNKFVGYETISKLKRKQLCQGLLFNKVVASKHNINTKLFIHLHFCDYIAYTKSKLSVPFTQYALTHNWTLW